MTRLVVGEAICEAMKMADIESSCMLHSQLSSIKVCNREAAGAVEAGEEVVVGEGFRELAGVGAHHNVDLDSVGILRFDLRSTNKSNKCCANIFSGSLPYAC